VIEVESVPVVGLATFFDGTEASVSEIQRLLVVTDWFVGSKYPGVQMWLKLLRADGHAEEYVPEGHWIVVSNGRGVRILDESDFAEQYRKVGSGE
jgi:hypothetical protein